MQNTGEIETHGHTGLIILTVVMAIFMVNLDTSIINVALPTLAANFHADPSDVSKVILTYLLALSSTLLLFGRLGDLKGSEKLFLTGYSIFTLGSLLCALAPGLEFLLGFRLLQGFGGAMLLSNWGAVIVRNLPPQMRGKAFGMITVAAGSGLAIGPPIGGLLVDYLDWRWIFLINIPVGILAIFFCLKLFRGKKGHSPDGSMDVPGAVFSIIMLFSLFYIFEIGPKAGWAAPVTLGFFGSMILFFILFLIRENKCDSPLMKISLFKNHNLTLSFGSRLLVMSILASLNFLFPFFFEGVRGLQPATVGMLLMVFPLTSFIGSPLAGHFSDKSSTRLVILVSGVLLVLATFAIWSFHGSTIWAFIIASFVVLGIGFALFMTGNITLIMSHAPHGNEGMITATVSVVSTIGSALGISISQVVYSWHLPNMENAADHLHASPEALTNGFQNASMVTVGAAILILLFSFFVRAKQHSE